MSPWRPTYVIYSDMDPPGLEAGAVLTDGRQPSRTLQAYFV